MILFISMKTKSVLKYLFPSILFALVACQSKQKTEWKMQFIIEKKMKHKEWIFWWQSEAIYSLKIKAHVSYFIILVFPFRYLLTFFCFLFIASAVLPTRFYCFSGIFASEGSPFQVQHGWETSNCYSCCGLYDW